MPKRRIFNIKLTESELNILEAKARAAGFSTKSEFVRFVLFVEITFLDKIDRIYRLINNDAKRRETE